MAKKTTRSARGKSRPTTTVGDVCAALQQIAPLELAQGWDNVGLLAGDHTAPVRRMLLCIDLTPPVAREAVRGRYDLVMAYHPPIFKPVPRLTAQDAGPESAVFRCITAGIAVYSTHTALDAAEGGTNDVIAGFCDITATEPLEFSPSPRPAEVKIIVFIPADCTDAVADAMFAAGAGHIGEYRKCSYRLDGRGTFLGSAATNPAVGRKQRFETVAETRLEMVCPEPAVPRVLAAMRAAHPYEEPACDVFPLLGEPVRGIGRTGQLPRSISLSGLAAKLKRATGAGGVQIAGNARQHLKRAIILVGAAGSLPFTAHPGPGDVIITGEIRHHDALSILRCGACAIALGHWTSERPVLAPMAARLLAALPGLRVAVSRADREPLAAC
jgi:dinuclear metal center YbgI/SA1388 family protein